MRLFLYALSSSALVLGSCVADDDEPLADETSEALSSVHFVGTPTCNSSGGTLTCSGKLAGLGNSAVRVEITVQRTCTNRGGNTPPGLVKGTTDLIQPRNGNITFVVTVEGQCPGNMVAKFTSPATVQVFDAAGRLLFSGTISFRS